MEKIIGAVRVWVFIQFCNMPVKRNGQQSNLHPQHDVVRLK